MGYLYKTSISLFGRKRQDDQQPGLNCPTANQVLSHGSPNQLAHKALLIFPPLEQFLVQQFSIISSYLFSLLSQGNTPSSVCVVISSSILGQQGESKTRTEA
jgi:hypothetical protein